MAAQKQYVAAWKSGSYLKWRGLSMREYSKYSRMLTLEPEMAVYCAVFDAVVDHDECPPTDRIPAGIVDFLGRVLLRNSAFSGNPEIIARSLNNRREALQTDYFEQSKAIIAGLFRMSFSEIDDLDEESFFDLLAKAELISGEKFDPTVAGKPKGEEDTHKRPKRPLNQTQARALDRTMRRGQL